MSTEYPVAISDDWRLKPFLIFIVRLKRKPIQKSLLSQVQIDKVGLKLKNKRKSQSGSLIETCSPFYVRMIYIWTFLADPSTKYRVCLAMQVANLRHPINLLIQQEGPSTSISSL